MGLIPLPRWNVLIMKLPEFAQVSAVHKYEKPGNILYVIKIIMILKLTTNIMFGENQREIRFETVGIEKDLNNIRHKRSCIGRGLIKPRVPLEERASADWW